MANHLPSIDETGIDALAAGNTAVRETLLRVARRQFGSLAEHERSVTTASGLPSQLPYEAPLLPLCISSAAGSRVVDVDGNEYIDCHMAYSGSVLGHAPPPVSAALREAVGRGVGAGHFTPTQVDLVELVREMVPHAERVALFHTGGEAVAAAVTMARAVTGNDLVAKFEGCYHGANDIGLINPTMALSGALPDGPPTGIKPHVATAGLPRSTAERFVVLPYGHPSAFEVLATHAEELACVVVDPLPPFTAGAIDEATDFIRRLRATTTALGVPLVFDEVVSGFRLARGGASEALGVTPEMSCFAKITSGLGLPLSLVVGAARFLEMVSTDGVFADFPARKAWLTSTNSSNELCVAASLAQLRMLDEDYEGLVGRIDAAHAELSTALGEIASETGLPIALLGHPRLQVALGIHAYEPTISYRDAMSQLTPTQLRELMILTFYLRLQGVYTKTVPTMNLSAAHTSRDVELIARAVSRAVSLMGAHGALS